MSLYWQTVQSLFATGAELLLQAICTVSVLLKNVKTENEMYVAKKRPDCVS